MNKKKYLFYLTLLILIIIISYIFKEKRIATEHSKIKSPEETLKSKYKNWNNLNPNFKEIIIKKYYPGLNIFSDWHYFNHVNDDKLKNQYLIQIPRHYVKDISLKFSGEITVYRILCKKNSNEKYKDWKKEIYEVAIIGSSCIHTNIVKKKFDEDIVKISSGGPISSDPIFIGQSEAGELNFEIIF